MDDTLIHTRKLSWFHAADFVSRKGMTIQEMRDATLKWNEWAREEATKMPPGEGRYSAVLAREVSKLGWTVLTFDDGGYAVMPRPHASDFLSLAGEIAPVTVITTADRVYASRVFSDILGRPDLCKGMIARDNVHPGGSYVSKPGWEWMGKPRFVIVDDSSETSEPLVNKLVYLGMDVGEQRLSGVSLKDGCLETVRMHHVHVPRYNPDEDRDDNTLLGSTIGEVKAKMASLSSR